MRIAKLDLLAYGPFRGLSLDLSAPGVHVVFGRNEAGKSTTLRAITGLLYGIERSTRDAHVHKPADLRIGGTLVGDDGEIIRVVRRKGNANTLLDDVGQPIDDAVVLRHLRGVGEQTFRHAFGLDHVTLRDGAKALLDGKGDLGESLFDASVGGGGEVQRLVAELDAEADRLWRPRGTALPLNDALKAFADAQKTIREKETLPAAHVTQQRELDATRELLAERIREKNELARRRSVVEAARKRVPLERRRGALVTERATFATADEQVAAADALVRRIPEHERALEEERRLAAERIRAGARVEDAARRAGVDGAAVNDTMRLDAPREARVHKLATDRERLLERIAAARVEIERQERALTKLYLPAHVGPADVGEGASSADTTVLVAALDSVRALGDLEIRIAADRAKVERRRRELEARAAGLGGHAHSLDALCGLALPALADVDAIQKRTDSSDRALARVEEELQKAKHDLEEVAGHIAESEGGFAPPDAADLQRVRAVRDQRWTDLRAAQTPTLRAAAEGAFESALRDADAMADRMLGEADRVTALGRLKARSEHLLATQTKLEVELDTQRRSRAALDDELRACFAPSEVRATTAAAMRKWLTDRVSLVDARAELVEQEREISVNAERLEQTRLALVAALGGAAGTAHAPLGESIAEAAKRVATSEDARRAAIDASRSRAKIEEELESRRASLARDESALSEVGTKLEAFVGPLGVGADASADEIRSAVESMRDLFASVDDRARIAAAAAAVDDEITAFVAAARAVAGPDTHDALEVARGFLHRRERLTRIDRDLAEIDARLAELGNETLPDDIAAIAADPDASAHALDDLDAHVDMVEREVLSLSQKIGGIEQGMATIQGDSRAADAAAAAQEALARVRTHAEKWVRAKLASVILKREIERYREQNQGPLLGRASTLFAQLTLGAFSGLRAGFDDKDRPALRLVRAGGAEVDVEALSEGTRDQLYLGLRLASLLRYAEIAAPMPFVLDDVLVHFDDQRSAAALSVLAQVAKTMQVVFFTHHARLVELARAAIPEGELVVHELATPLSPDAADQRQWM